jgi:hypothetical protein
MNQRDEEENSGHHCADAEQHDAVNAARKQAAGDVPDDAPKRDQNEENANQSDLERFAPWRHS